MLSILNETKTKVFQQEQLTVRIFPSIQEMGSVAAKEVGDKFVAYWKANRK
jgi:glucosamine-6-phosphate deaminase